MKAWSRNFFPPTRFPVNLDDLTGDERSQVCSMLLEWQKKGNASNAQPSDAIEFLERLLGPSVCRRLGIYRLPENFLL